MQDLQIAMPLSIQRLPLAALLMMGMLSTGACSSQSTPPVEDVSEDDTLRVTVHWSETRQTIHGFGASGAWSTRFVGANWPSSKKNRIADLLFSQELDTEGQPEGIGLSTWRFNIGAGSAEQGEASGIPDPWRRAEGFLQADGTYDWSRQEGQQWFLQAAQDRGVSTLIAFANSPPVELTANGKAYGDGDGDANLPDDRFDDYAAFLGTVMEHFDSEGLAFDYVSPINEPQWDWSEGNGQEGSPYTNEEIETLTRALNQELEDRSVSTKIEIPETAQINYLYQSDTGLPQRDDQIKVFFGEADLQSLPSVSSNVAAHSYFTTWPVRDMIEQRERLAGRMESVDPSLSYTMSEYCILADNSQIQGNGRDLGMKPALYVARLIHFDLTVAQASSWQWWLAVSPYDYKDGLVYIDKDQQNGAVYESKLLWGLGNYSRFLRPGALRVAVSRSDEASDIETAEGVMISAYRSHEEDEVVVVAVNRDTEERAVILDVEGGDSGGVQEWDTYQTTDSLDLAPGPTVDAGTSIRLPARSIVTLVGQR